MSILLQVEVVDDILKNLAHQGPIVGICIILCIYFYKQLGKKEKEISALTDKKDKEINVLNEYIRETDKENLQILNDVNNTLDKVLENQKQSNEMVVKEIHTLKEYIFIKLDRKN